MLERAVDALDAIAEACLDGQLDVALARGHREIVGRLAIEVGAQVHAVVGQARLFADHRDGELALWITLAELFHEAMTDEPVADHDDACVTVCF